MVQNVGFTVRATDEGLLCDPSGTQLPAGLTDVLTLLPTSHTTSFALVHIQTQDHSDMLPILEKNLCLI